MSKNTTVSIKSGDSRYVAHHEAAHAVVSLSMGYPCDSVTIIPSDGAAGHAVHTRTQPQEHPLGENWWHFTHAVILYAGHQATLRLGFEEDVEAAGAEPDYYSAAKHIQDIAFADDEACIALEGRAKAHARDIVDMCWDAIEQLANELVVRKTLTGEDVQELFDVSRLFADLKTA